MQSSLKKSLYLGLAALSFGAVAATSTNASAKSYAKAGAYTTLKSDATTRNVEATGTNALYTKPGTVKGAKVVASKATMAKLASSKKSTDYFRAYGVKTTDRGSVYYRVVTMDQKYRGYVYGGKTTDAFAGGIKSANTTTAATVSNDIKGKAVYFTNPGTTNVTWNAPKFTQYKASKNVKNTTPFVGDALTVTDAVTKTREGSLYYYVKDATNPSASGWIYSKAITTDANVVFNQAKDIKVNFTFNGKTVKTSVMQNLKADANGAQGTVAANAVGTAVGYDVLAKATANNDAWLTAALSGTGYTYDGTTSANKAALLAAKTGDTVNLTVTQNAAVTTPISLMSAATTTTSNDAKALVRATSSSVASQYSVVVPSLTSGFKGVNGAPYTSADLTTFAGSNNLKTLYTKTIGTGSDAYYYEYNLTSATAGNYSATKPATLVYVGTKVNGTSPAKLATNDGDSVWGNDTDSSVASSSTATATSSTTVATSSTKAASESVSGK
ncbi:MAG TPA: hypothetical protein H9875_00785 [Candidatus Levilactobacillus faecigallinarum]|uniref:S-layer protein n=1 Tax=Candidatus Levilactobacillus faecigallinarum TaxID=2838638 RepID=A0A9D1QSB8_9LACO|nr:hypothetical protein [Candidatus Levilactobacillus faecigallinarum]